MGVVGENWAIPNHSLRWVNTAEESLDDRDLTYLADDVGSKERIHLIFVCGPVCQILSLTRTCLHLQLVRICCVFYTRNFSHTFRSICIYNNEYRSPESKQNNVSTYFLNIDRHVHKSFKFIKEHDPTINIHKVDHIIWYVTMSQACVLTVSNSFPYKSHN